MVHIVTTTSQQLYSFVSLYCQIWIEALFEIQYNSSSGNTSQWNLLTGSTHAFPAENIHWKLLLVITAIIIIRRIQLFICLRAELNSQCPFTDSSRIQTTAIRETQGQKKQKTKKMHQLRLFTFKRDILKISVDLQAALAAETQLKDSGWRSI
jgi:hypothetical protein